jgi:hypothetical protein
MRDEARPTSLIHGFGPMPEWPVVDADEADATDEADEAIARATEALLPHTAPGPGVMTPELYDALEKLADGAQEETERRRYSGMRLLRGRPFTAHDIDVRPTPWGPRWFLTYTTDDGENGTLPVPMGKHPRRDAFLEAASQHTPVHLVLEAIPQLKGAGAPSLVFKVVL